MQAIRDAVDRSRRPPDPVADRPTAAIAPNADLVKVRGRVEVSRTALRSPFDRLVHDRDRTMGLFDFE
ncbi:MAG: hypothetical protein ACRDWI_06075 [Jiangellaceae bacterium]